MTISGPTTPPGGQEEEVRPTARNAEPLRPVHGPFLAGGAGGSTSGALIRHGFMGVGICTRQKLENLRPLK